MANKYPNIREQLKKFRKQQPQKILDNPNPIKENI